MIEVKHLTKRYGDHNAIEDLSFQVDDGQIYGFLGPNGAGKSTTMNIMTGYLAPTSGEVLINGHDILDEPLEARKTIGYLPEVPPVYPDMTVLEYLRFVAELKKVPKAERAAQVEEAMKDLDLEEMGSRLIKNLSKGYRQRVGFAQALLGNPETLILDEPTVGLDPKQILEIRELIKSLGEKHTVILSSHILSEVSEVCDQVLIINHGKFVACDTPENLEKGRGGGSVLTVSAQGDEKTVLAALRTVIQVTEKDLTEKDGSVTASISVPEGTDVRGRISEALFKAGCPVLEMNTKRANLEDIFLELTEEDQKSPDSGEISEEGVKEDSGNDGTDPVHAGKPDDGQTDSMTEGEEKESDFTEERQPESDGKGEERS